MIATGGAAGGEMRERLGISDSVADYVSAVAAPVAAPASAPAAAASPEAGKEVMREVGGCSEDAQRRGAGRRRQWGSGCGKETGRWEG